MLTFPSLCVWRRRAREPRVVHTACLLLRKGSSVPLRRHLRRGPPQRLPNLGSAFSASSTVTTPRFARDRRYAAHAQSNGRARRGLCPACGPPAAVLGHCGPGPSAAPFPRGPNPRASGHGGGTHPLMLPGTVGGRLAPPPPTAQQSMISLLQRQIKSLEDIINTHRKNLAESRGGRPSPGPSRCPPPCSGGRKRCCGAGRPGLPVPLGGQRHRPPAPRAHRGLPVPKRDPPDPPLRQVLAHGLPRISKWPRGILPFTV